MANTLSLELHVGDMASYPMIDLEGTETEGEVIDLAVELAREAFHAIERLKEHRGIIS